LRRRFKIVEPLRVLGVRRAQAGEYRLLEAARISFVIEAEDGAKTRANSWLQAPPGSGDFLYELLTADAGDKAIDDLAAGREVTIEQGLLVDLLAAGITPGAVVAVAWEAAEARGRDLRFAGSRIADARRRCEAAARALRRVQDLRLTLGDRVVGRHGVAVGRAVKLGLVGKFALLGPGGARLIIDLNDAARALEDFERNLKPRGRPSGAGFPGAWVEMAREECGDSLFSLGARVYSIIIGRKVTRQSFREMTREK
jgi:hypothetical protein